MMDKIKAFWGKVGQWGLYVVTPVAFLAGMAAYILGDRDKWKAKFERQDMDTKIRDLVQEKANANKMANDAEADYRDALREYESRGRPGGTDVQ